MTEPTPETTPDETTTSTVEPASREARRYRHRLRDAEAREAALSSRLENYQRAEVERLAGETLATPGDFWLTGPDLPELLDDDGNVDAEKVSAAVAAVVETRPGWALPLPPPSQDGGARQTPRRGPGWSGILRGDDRRAS